MAMSARVTNTVHGIVAEKRNGVRTFHRHDPLGSTIGLVNDSATTTDTYTYWPYGTLQASSCSTQQPWKFGGQWGYYYDSTTHTYIRARKFRKDLGRWMTVDPIWPDQLSYSYGSSNPTRHMDPSGLSIAQVPDCVPPKKEDPSALSKWCTDAWHKIYPNDALPKDVEGRVFCCNNQKVICVFNAPPDVPEVEACVRRHEQFHRDNTDCESTRGYCLIKIPPLARDVFANECTAYAIEIRCYVERRKNCKTERCRSTIFEEMCHSCKRVVTNCQNAGLPVPRDIVRICSTCMWWPRPR